MERKYVVASIAILLAFSVGLVGFFLVSEGIPDGLDKTLEEHGTGEESDPIYTAPLDYGSSYFSSLIMGIVGFLITLLAVYGIVRLRKSMRSA
ncbi:MAG: hypothetical protein ISF22_08595 [Methanomassiliicoccus sp.]|nr:hypothetical protein [Methanomassiliicoccus sp.]